MCGRAGLFTWRIQILNAHPPQTLLAARLQVTANRRDQRTEVQRPSGRGREAPDVTGRLAQLGFGLHLLQHADRYFSKALVSNCNLYWPSGMLTRASLVEAMIDKRYWAIEPSSTGAVARPTNINAKIP